MQNTPTNQKPKIFLIIVATIGVIALFALVAIVAPKISLATPKQIVSTTPGQYRITEVYDGDTIAVAMDGRTEKVRMIGVDTPETHKPNSPIECGGPEASSFAHKQLDGKAVRLEADPTNQNRDRYDRLLRYVYLPDGTLFNKLLITEGFGTPYTSFPFQKKQEFINAGLQAKLDNKGVWAGYCTVDDQNGRFKTNPI